jgi:hypothetical protein
MSSLEIRYIPLFRVQKWHWERNPKKHDTNKIIESIAANGFRDPPAYDSALNNGDGGIVEGNGRIEALVHMRDAKMPVPKYLALDENSEWCVPILFGADSLSCTAAERYGVDHNNLTLFGFSAVEAAEIWDKQAYVELLMSLKTADNLPASVNEADLEKILASAVPVEKKPKGEKPLSFFVTAEERKIIETALEAANMNNVSQALVQICEVFLQGN